MMTAANADPTLLCSLESARVDFGSVTVISDVSLDVRVGEVLGIIGPNGSGKTTLLNVISGFVKPLSGQPRWIGRRRSGSRPEALARHGVGRTFQQPRLVGELSCVDNVRLALHAAPPAQGMSPAKRCRELLDEVGIASADHDLRVDQLSFGTQRLVDFARALATAHRVLLLDEPTAGSSPDDWEKVGNIIAALKARDVAVVVTDHNLGFMRTVCERAVFLHHGQLLAQGALADVLNEPIVREAYVGAGRAKGVLLRSPTATSGSEHTDSGLVVKGLTAGYTGEAVLHEVSFEVPPATMLGVVGANGAGKTTLVDTIAGVVASRTGSVVVDGCDLTKLPPLGRVRAGVAHVREGRPVFRSLSVLENLYVAQRGPRSERGAAVSSVIERFPALEAKLNFPAGSLSGGQQQMLVIARALMSRPKILLLDEPTLGLAPSVADALMDQIAAIAASGIAVLVTDQDARRVLSVADHCLVLSAGHNVLSGPQAEMESRIEEIERAYLGDA